VLLVLHFIRFNPLRVTVPQTPRWLFIVFDDLVDQEDGIHVFACRLLVGFRYAQSHLQSVHKSYWLESRMFRIEHQASKLGIPMCPVMCTVGVQLPYSLGCRYVQ
jgi:hypothetical protein